MKKIFTGLISCLFLSFFLFGEDIRIEDVVDYSWEATSFKSRNETSDQYYFFDFTPGGNSVKLRIKDIYSNDLQNRSLKYSEYFEETPQHIRIFSYDVENPLFVIEYGDNPEIIIKSHDPDIRFYRTFETLKNDYQRLGLQAIQNFDRVRLRTAPNLESNKIGSLMKGDVMNILNRSAQMMKINDMNAFWFKVQTSDGLTGWTYGSFLEIGQLAYKNSREGIIIFQKTLALDQGANQRFLFYKNNENIHDSGWLGSNKILFFEDVKKMVSGKENSHFDYFNGSNELTNPSHVYIFNFDGTIVSDFEISETTIKIKKVDSAPLFYSIESYGLDAVEQWSNKCVVYDLNGSPVEEFLYNETVHFYSFEYMGKSLTIELMKP